MLNRSGAVVYVGNLPDDIRERELEDLFHKVRTWVSLYPGLFASSRARTGRRFLFELSEM